MTDADARPHAEVSLGDNDERLNRFENLCVRVRRSRHATAQHDAVRTVERDDLDLGPADVDADPHPAGLGASRLKTVRMHFAPYIYFYGRCEEALEFYKGVFGGTYEAMRIAGSPMAEHSPPDFQQKILHATFTAPGISFMAADGRPGSVDPEAGNIALSISTDEVEGTRIFDALAEGGAVSMPLQKMFWGATFGQLVDRFGTEWMLNLT